MATLVESASGLVAYMNYLEASNDDWRRIGDVKANRTTARYRGYLIGRRSAGEIAASTASARMAVVIRFYRWLSAERLLVNESQEAEKKILVRISDRVGAQRSLIRTLDDLSIPNRARMRTALEGGLHPVSAAQRDTLLAIAEARASKELYLMLALGFGTGMRLGSIADLKIKTIQLATTHPLSERICYLSIGPGVRAAPVATKFGVTGRVVIPAHLLEKITEYMNSMRRLRREAKASSADRSLVFLTKNGTPYSRSGADRSSVVNVEMSRLRASAAANGHDFSGFKFHCSRATFATGIAETAIRMGGAAGAGNAVRLVRDLLLHKNEASALKYINFIQDQRIKEEWSNRFTREFVGAHLCRQAGDDEC